jgi:hypothetical protein
MQTVRQLPGLVKIAAAFIGLGIAHGIVGGRADAIFVWALPLLWRQVSLFGGDLLFAAAFAWILGMLTLFLLQKTGVALAVGPITTSEVDRGQLNPPLAELGPREKAEAELADVLQEIAEGNTESLPRILPRLRYIFDRLERGQDSAWCQAELHGYSADDTPQYRYAEVTIDWNSGGVVSWNRMTGRVEGKPPERVVSLPVGAPVEELVRISRTGKRTATGTIEPGLMGAWHEVAEISPQAVQGVLRRIADECYQRALAAKTN